MVKNLPANARDAKDPGSNPELGRFSGEGNGTSKQAPLQYACLENPMFRGAPQAMVHGVAKSWTQLSDFTFHIEKQRHCFANKGLSSQSYGFSSSHVWI